MQVLLSRDPDATPPADAAEVDAALQRAWAEPRAACRVPLRL
jgi:hypothetical protein